MITYGGVSLNAYDLKKLMQEDGENCATFTYIALSSASEWQFRVRALQMGDYVNNQVFFSFLAVVFFYV